MEELDERTVQLLFNTLNLSDSDYNLSGLLSNFSLPDSIHLQLNITRLLHWYIVFIVIISLILYIYALKSVLTSEKSQQKPYLLAIVSADLAMLLTSGVVILVLMFSADHPHPIGMFMCKALVFAINGTSFFTNWCWCLVGGHRYV